MLCGDGLCRAFFGFQALVEICERHIRFIEFRLVEPGSFHVCSAQICSTQIGVAEICPPQIRAAEMRATEICSMKICLLEIDIAEIGTPSIGMAYIRFLQVGFLQVGFLQVGLGKICFVKIKSAQIKSVQLSLVKIWLESLDIRPGLSPPVPKDFPGEKKIKKILMCHAIVPSYASIQRCRSLFFPASPLALPGLQEKLCSTLKCSC
jgi:hypothetical protein